MTITDVESTSRRDRQATGTLTVDVLGAPDAPGTPAQTGPTLSESARLAWAAPRDNGLPIEVYEVAWEGGTQLCPASPCLVTGLENAVPHRFTVRARNAVGFGPPSPQSAPVIPDEVPGAPVDPRVVEPNDHVVTVTWSPAPSTGSAVDDYLVTWPGGQSETTSTQVTAGGLDNSVRTPFTIKAHNKAGWGPPVTVEGQSAGVPATPDAPSIQTTEIGGGASQAVVVTWNAVAPNGPGDTKYAVTRTGPGGTATVCTTTTTRCEAEAVANDGSTYEYRVTASNDVFSSAAGPATSQRAVGTPGDFTSVSAVATGVDRQVRLRFTSPPARDDSETITCRVAGTTCGQWPPGAAPPLQPAGHGARQRSTFTFTLTATNTGGLRSSTTVDSDVVYGPLGAVGVTVESVVGPYVTFTVTADPNGRPADVTVTVAEGMPGPSPSTTPPGTWPGPRPGRARSATPTPSSSRPR